MKINYNENSGKTFERDDYDVSDKEKMMITKRGRKNFRKYYTVTNAQEAGITLEPLICPKCKSIKNVVYNSKQQIGFCEKCGHVNRGLHRR